MEVVRGGYGTFYLYDLHLAILVSKGRFVRTGRIKISSSCRKPHTSLEESMSVSERGKILPHRSWESVHAMQTHLLSHMKRFFSSGIADLTMQK